METTHVNITHKTHVASFGKVNILYLNINSLKNKLNELEFLIGSYGNTIIHIIALTEIRTKTEENDKYCLHEYNAYFSNRQDGHGGVALYIHESFLSCLVESECTNNINFLCGKIIDLNIFIGVIYKQPLVSKSGFMEYMGSKIENIQNMILIGDMNINLLNANGITNSYVNTCMCNGYVILNKIAKKYATRTSSLANGTKTVTIIDHVVTDLLNYKYVMSLMNTHLSDHKMILLNFHGEEIKSLMHRKVKKKELKNYTDSYILSQKIAELNIHNTPQLDTFISKVKLIRQSAIKRKEIVSVINPNKPWVNQELIELIDERNRYYKLKKKSRSNQYVSDKYNDYTQRVKKLCHKLRNDYNSNLLNRYMGKPKYMWQKFNEIIHNKPKDRNVIRALNEMVYGNNGAEIICNSIKIEPKQIGEIFNEYYSKVGKILFDRIDECNSNEFQMLTPYNAHTIFLRPTTPIEMDRNIAALKNSKSISDIISADSLKSNTKIVSPLIAEYVNAIMNTGDFHDELKLNRIVPILKCGNPLDASNYRPINILPSLSKLIEMVLYDRIYDFSMQFGLINANQFGFQRQSGTLSAVTTLINHIQKGIDNDKNGIGGCIFIDLKCAFDTIPHHILLKKLYRQGIRGVAHRLIENYVSNRRQFVDIGGVYSSVITNTNPFSVAQGSNLGPLLFLLFVNDVFHLTLHGKLILFADDACLSYVENDPLIMKSHMQKDIDILAKWFINNRVTMNVKKTKAMLISKNHSNRTVSLNLRSQNNPIEQVEKFRYLGITIQNDLKWNEHTNSISRKISSLGGVIRRIGRKVATNTLTSIYYSCVHSHLTYLSPIWGPTLTDGEAKALQILQNKIIRKIYQYDYEMLNISTNGIYSKYQIPKLRQIIELNQCLLIYKIHKKTIKLDYQLERSNHNHDYHTRNRRTISLGDARTRLGMNSAIRAASQTFNKYRLWNHDDAHIHKFKKIIKCKILL